MRLQTRDGGVLGQPDESKQIAFADNVVSCLYDNISCKGGSQDLSSLVSYCPQASMLRQRMTKSGAWLRSQGKDVWGLDPSFKSRVQTISKGNLPIDELYKTNVGTSTHEYDRTLAVVAATGVVTGVDTDFDGSVAAAADLAAGAPYAPAVPLVQVGDICVIPLTIGGYTEHVVTVVTNATTLTILPSVSADVGATTNIFFVRHTEEQSRKNTQTILWKPPVGLFDAEKLGAGDYRISLNPNARYKQSSIECVSNLPVYNSLAAANGTFNFEVLDVKLYVSLSKENVPISGLEPIRLQEQHLQSKPITGLETSMDFSVPPSTQMLAFFVQSGKTGADLRFPSTKFKSEHNYDMALESFQLTYANQSRPSTRWATEYKDLNGATQGISTFAQRYNDTFSECGLSDLQGGTETMSEWIKRGPFYCYRFDRDTNDKSTQVQLQIKFREYFPNTNIILCAYYDKAITIAYSNGMINEVRSLNV
jgi:nuclear transport factor 2 (NTF2) superfamily protein